MNTTPPQPGPDPSSPWWRRLHAALMPDYNRKAAIYWWLLVVLGTAALLHATSSVALLPTPSLAQVLIGCLVAVVAGMFPVRISGSTNSFAAGEIFIFLLLLMHGPAAATLAAAGEAFVGSARSSKRWTSRIASPCTASIAMTVAGNALSAAFGELARWSAFNEVALMVVTMVMSIGYFMLNALLINLVVLFKQKTGSSLRAIFGNVRWVGITYAASALIAAMLYLTFRQVGVAVLVAAIPMVAMLLSTLHYHIRHREADDAARLMHIDAAARLAESQRRFHSAFSHAAIGMALVSPDGQVLQANPALCRLLDRNEAEVAGHRFADFVHPNDVQTLLLRLLDVVNHTTTGTTVELRCHRPQGHEVWVAVHGAYFSHSDSTEPCLIVQAEDITARRAAEERLQHAAHHDSLTLLPNRTRFSQCLAYAIERCKADPQRRFAVMYLDFDRFKLINDTLGHSAGDQFLVMVAKRIREQTRTVDTIGRLGGDEFAILVDDLDTEDSAIRLAERLQHALSRPYVLGGMEVNSSASIGVTFSSIGYQAPDEVLRDADIAMYRAKAGGRARYALFDAELRAQVSDKVQLEADLRRALEQGQLSLTYQPIYDLQTSRIVSFEALARWAHPQRGWIAPDIFIPLAEELGLVSLLTKTVLSSACEQLKAWHGMGHRQLRIQVNISGMDLCNGSIVPEVARALQANGLVPADLTLEITESVLMTRLDNVLPVLTQLRDLGVNLSVDDFGTGYSSLSYLSTLPITGLKIDRSFVHRMVDTTQDAEIVKLIIALGSLLGKTVVAEGIETTAQLDRLRAMGCGFGQGHLLGFPFTAQAAQALLDATAASRGSMPVPLLVSELSTSTLH